MQLFYIIHNSLKEKIDCVQNLSFEKKYYCLSFIFNFTYKFLIIDDPASSYDE